MKAKIKFYLVCIEWLWRHREEVNNRAKWRRMMREIKFEVE